MTRLSVITRYFLPAREPIIFLLLMYPSLAAGGPITEQRQLELVNMIRHDCGSCHGMTLRGGLGPPLTPDALAGKNHGLLYNTIVLGRGNTAMPPWQGLLSKDEIEWIVLRLQEGDLDSRMPIDD